MILILEVTSYKGYSLNAEHCYGEVWINGEKISISRKLTQKQADKLNKKDSTFTWEPGDSNTQFWDEEELITSAISMLKEMNIKYDLLLMGRTTCSSVQRAIAGDPKIIEAINILWKEAEALNYYSGKDDDRMKIIDHQFDLLIKPYNH